MMTALHDVNSKYNELAFLHHCQSGDVVLCSMKLNKKACILHSKTGMKEREKRFSVLM